jgi:hypothetical protein
MNGLTRRYLRVDRVARAGSPIVTCVVCGYGGEWGVEVADNDSTVESRTVFGVELEMWLAPSAPSVVPLFGSQPRIDSLHTSG